MLKIFITFTTLMFWSQTTFADKTEEERIEGFQVVTKQQYHDSNTNITWITQYKCLQIWGTNAVTETTVCYDAHYNVWAAIDMRVVTQPDVDFWIKALELISVQTHLGAPDKRSLYGKTNLWETRFEWWTQNSTYTKRVTEVTDLPLKYAEMENNLRQLTKGTDKASLIWPKRDFIGMRWTYIAKKGDRPTFPPSGKDWLDTKLKSGPQQLFTVIKKKGMPTSVTNKLTFYSRWLSFEAEKDGKPIAIEFFEIP